MKHTLSPIAAGILLLLGLGIAPSAHSELPELEEKEWLGCFAGHKGSKVRLTVSTTAEILIQPIYKRGEARAYVRMPVTWGLEVTMPNGRKGIQEVIPESLASDDKTSTELEQTTIRGKFEGGAEAEVTIEQNRGIVSIGGRITNPGTYKPENIQFHVSAQVLNFYGRKKLELQNDPEAFEELISDDLVKLKWTNNKRLKFDFIEPRDMATEEVNGPGVAEVETSIKAIDHEFFFEATGNSSITLSNRKSAALHEGMKVNWIPDATKDSGATARLEITVK